MSSHYPLQNMREGDRSTGSNGDTSVIRTAPHPLPVSLSSSTISDCPFASSRPVSPAEGGGDFTPLDCPFSSVSSPTKRIIGELFSATSIPPANPLPSFPHSETLVSSPYPQESHHLKLSTVPWTYRLLALALTQLANAVPTFATSPYDLSFNWGTVISTARALHEKYEPHPDHTKGKLRSPSSTAPQFPRTTAYVIVFRSRRALPLLPATSERLGELDSLAHEEAAISGGLLKYWFGSPNPQTGRNLATCLWVDHEHAVRGGGGPGHRKAMREAKSAYVGWEVERLRLVIEEGGEEYRFEKW